MSDIDFKPYIEGVVARSSIQAFSTLPENLTHERAASALERDDFVCQECGDEGFHDGDVDLVLTYDTNPRLLGSDEDESRVDNLRTVCSECESNQKDVETLLSVQPEPSRSDKLADAVRGLNKFAASTDGWSFVKSQAKDIFRIYLLLIFIGGIVGFIIERGFLWGFEAVASAPIDAFLWIPENYPLLGIFTYLFLIYPILFLLFEHSLFETFRPRYEGKKTLLWLLAILGFQAVWLPPYLNELFDLGLPIAVSFSLGYGAWAGILVGWKFRSVLKRLAYSDWTKTIRESYKRSDLKEYERRQLEPSDLEGLNYFPLVWLFAGRLSVYAQIYVLMFYSGQVYVETAMLSSPLIVGILYLVWRWYQFNSIPVLTYNGHSLTDDS